MSIRIEYVGDVVVAILEGRFMGLKETDALKTTLMKLIREEGREKILLDFGQTKFMDDGAILALLKVHHAALDHGCHMVLCAVNRRLTQVLIMIWSGFQCSRRGMRRSRPSRKSRSADLLAC